MLHFGAVDWETTVFVNGRNLGSHRGGYDPFTFDITAALRKEDQQEITVSVWDPTDASWQLRGKQTLHPGGAAYTACSGIWQTVWLEPVPESSIESLHLVPDVASGTLKVVVDARTPVGTTNVRVVVSEGGRTVSSATGTLGAELTKGVRENLAWYKARLIWVTTDVTVSMKDAKLWTPDSPTLYDVTVQLLGDDGSLLDSVTSYVGMRSIAVGKDEHGVPRPMLNGKSIMLPGALDQGYWPDGIYTAPTDAALRFDIEAAKRLGLDGDPQTPQGRAGAILLLGRPPGPAYPSGFSQWPRRRSVHRPSHVARSLNRVRNGTAAPDPEPLEPSFDHRLGAVQRRLGAARYAAPCAAGSGNSIPRG